MTASDDIGKLDSDYDILETSKWITENNFKRISLQFPDHLLCDSHSVCHRLEELTKAKIYVAVDTTYSNCCVDEISAKHIEAEAIVHYGHACLSPCNSTVFYVHPKSELEVESAAKCILSASKDDVKTVVFFHTSYNHVYTKLHDLLKTNATTVYVARLKSDLKLSENTIFGREIVNNNLEVQNQSILDNCQIIYIGSEDQTVFNLSITIKTKLLYIMNTTEYILKPYSQNIWFKRRRYLIEKCKDAKNIGILVCTLSIANFNTIIERIRELIRLNGKMSYTLTIGKPNIAKLANLYEIDVYVLVACPENELYLCRDFLQPIVYPYELELALNQSRDQYAMDYVTDFNDLLSGGKSYCELSGNAGTSDISLITGSIRCGIPAEDEEDEDVKDAETRIMKRDKWEVMEAQIGNALSERSWRGLEQKLGETPVEKVQQGRKGIASGYKEEPS